MAEQKSLIGGGLCCLVCILFVVLIIVLVGVGTVEPIQYGIIYNKFSKKVNTEEGVKPGGWYWIGWTNNFIYFPATQVNMDFTSYKNSKYDPIKLKDQQGQSITLGFALQYKLKQDKVIALYAKYISTWEDKWKNLIKTEVTSEVGKFKNTAFWQDRSASGLKLLTRLKANVEIQEYADIIAFQILDVTLLPQREITLERTQLTKQQKFTLEKEFTAKATRSGISVTKSETLKQITEIVGKANADSKNHIAKAQVLATKTILDATTAAYGELKTQIQITPENGLDEFIFYSDLQSAEDTDILFNIKNAFIKT